MEIVDSDFLMEAIELNSSNEMKLNYHKYSDECGYWILKNVWKNFNKYAELSEKYPIFPPTECINKNNPFFKQPISPIQLYEIKYKLLELNKIFFNYNIKEEYKISSNVFIPNVKYPCKYSSLLPHCDVYDRSDILVANIWVSNGYNGKTIFWKYRDSYKFTKKLIEYYYSLKNLNEIVLYENFSAKDGFEIVSESPTEFGSISIYNGNQIHSAWIPPDIQHKRLSHIVTIK